MQGANVGTLGIYNERNSSYFSLAYTSKYSLCFYVSLPNEIKLLFFNIFFLGTSPSNHIIYRVNNWGYFDSAPKYRVNLVLF